MGFCLNPVKYGKFTKCMSIYTPGDRDWVSISTYLKHVVLICGGSRISPTGGGLINSYRPQTKFGGQGIIFTSVCQEFCSQGGGCAIPVCIAGGILACLAAGLQGRVVSQHALQVSRHTPRGKLRGIWIVGSSGQHWGWGVCSFGVYH